MLTLRTLRSCAGSTLALEHDGGSLLREADLAASSAEEGIAAGRVHFVEDSIDLAVHVEVDTAEMGIAVEGNVQDIVEGGIAGMDSRIGLSQAHSTAALTLCGD